MASRTVTAKPNELPVYSRFSVLEEESCNSSDEEKVKDENKNDDAKKMSKSAKKRARKKKRTANDAVESEQLRNMAFRAKPVVKSQSIPPGITTSQGIDEKPSLEPSDPSLGWDNWRERDEQFVVDKFQQDLERALHQSMIEAREHQKKIEELIAIENMGAAKLRKDHPTKMSLSEFQMMQELNERRMHDEREHFTTDQMEDRQFSDGENLQNGAICSHTEILTENSLHSIQKEKKKKKKKRKPATETNTNGFLDEYLHEEEKETQDETPYELDPASIAHWRYEVEKKDKIIANLKVALDALQGELAQVKRRNKQLCFILGQGEMKDKSDLVQQIEELTIVKDELSTELSEMHSALEQERSKVSTLKQELAKHQGSKAKRQSTSEH